MEYHNFVPITADLTGAADAYNQCHYQVSSSFISKSGYFFWKSGCSLKNWIFLSVSERTSGWTEWIRIERVCWIWLAWINQIHTIKLFIIWYKYKIQFSTRNEPNCIIRDSNRIVRGSSSLKVERKVSVSSSDLSCSWNPRLGRVILRLVPLMTCCIRYASIRTSYCGWQPLIITTICGLKFYLYMQTMITFKYF